MTLDDRIYNFIARRVAFGATPSDRAIQTHFKLQSTDSALSAVNRLRAAGRISVEQEGSRRLIYCTTLPSVSGQVPIDEVCQPEPLQPFVATIVIKRASAGTIDRAFIAEVTAFIAETGMSGSAFGLAAVNDGKFVTRRLHSALLAKTHTKVRGFMAAYRARVDQCAAATVVDEPKPAIVDGSAERRLKEPVTLAEPNSERQMAALIREWARQEGVAPNIYAVDLCIAALSTLEINASEKMKPRIKSSVMKAQVESGVSFDQFITDLIDMGLACYLEGAL